MVTKNLVCPHVKTDRLWPFWQLELGGGEGGGGEVDKSNAYNYEM